MRGVFRKHVVFENNIFIRQNNKVSTYQDQYWIFALLLYGNFVFTEETFSIKTYSKGTAHSLWDWGTSFVSNKFARRLILEYTFQSRLPNSIKAGIKNKMNQRTIKIKAYSFVRYCLRPGKKFLKYILKERIIRSYRKWRDRNSIFEKDNKRK